MTSSLCASAIASSAAQNEAGGEPDSDTFRNAVEAAFKSKDKPVDLLLCRPPKTGRGLFGSVETSAITRVLIAPVAAETQAFNEHDHVRRFDGAVLQLSICLARTPASKEMCIIVPVLRKNGSLCLR